MAQWEGKSHGSVLGYRIFIAFIRVGGVAAAYWLLKIVSFYFFLFVRKPRHYMMQFYMRDMGFSREKAKNLTRQNFYLIGQSIIDRTIFNSEEGGKFSYTMNGDHYLKQIAEAGNGGILISGHLGNWEIAGNLLKDFQKPVNVVMFDAEHQQIKQYLDEKKGGTAFKVIPIKENLSHIFQIKEALAQGEIVCLHGDRFLPGQRTLQLQFLGKWARFPYGPFHIASKFASPVSFVFGLKESDYKYKFSATPPMAGMMQPEQYASAFVKILEEKVKENPEQWFNYYDFFKLDESEKPA